MRAEPAAGGGTRPFTRVGLEGRASARCRPRGPKVPEAGFPARPERRLRARPGGQLVAAAEARRAACGCGRGQAGSSGRQGCRRGEPAFASPRARPPAFTRRPRWWAFLSDLSVGRRASASPQLGTRTCPVPSQLPGGWSSARNQNLPGLVTHSLPWALLQFSCRLTSIIACADAFLMTSQEPRGHRRSLLSYFDAHGAVPAERPIPEFAPHWRPTSRPRPSLEPLLAV